MDIDTSSTPMNENSNLFDKAEVLLAAENLLKESVEYGDEQQDWLIKNLALLCYSHGVLATENKDKIEPFKTVDDRLYNAIGIGQMVWDHISAYMKDTSAVELHPLGFLATLYAFSEEQDFQDLKEVITTFSKDWIKLQIEDAKKVPEVVPRPEIENFAGDPRELIDAFFNMAQELGTFYSDRDKYSTDHERDLHDRLVAIYKKVFEGK